MKIRATLATLGLLTASGALVGPAGAATPHLYVAPTFGVWRWDTNVTPDYEVGDRSQPVFGGRVGYAPLEAFSGEIVLLTGTNDLHLGDDDGAPSEAIRTTQIEISFLVNFQTLVESRVYPFLNLGGGMALRRGKAGETVLLDDNPFVFHLGGGVRADLGDRWGLRLTARDTFFTETQESGNQENQVTVDSVEFSLSLEYRLPVGGRGPRRLR